MAFDNPPFTANGTTVPGETIRRALGTLTGTTGGIITPGDLAVTQNATPNMSVNVGVGQVWVPGSHTSTQGPYYARNGAAINVPIGASSTLPRIDLIVAQALDETYGDASTGMSAVAVPGTPTAGATLSNPLGAAALPVSSLRLAYVLVPASATSITTADILNVAQILGGTTNPWTPLTLTSGLSAGSSDYPPAARVEGDLVRLRGIITNGSGGTISTLFTMPLSEMNPGDATNVLGNLTSGVGGEQGVTEIAISTSGVATAAVPNGYSVYLNNATYCLD